MELSLGRNIKPVVRHLKHTGVRWTGPVSIGLALAVWEGLAHWGTIPAFILPAPEMVWKRFWLARV